MASGKTLDIIAFSRSVMYWPVKPWVQKERDRSLPGKARVRARKAARRGN
jgi:hypothetical protein